MSAFSELSLLLIISAIAGAISVRLRQPVIIAFILVGIVAGPAVLGLLSAHEQIALLAEVGISVLLFLVGLKLDLHHVRHVGPIALATGLGQLAFTIAGGFGLVLLLGKGAMEALYIAIALTFSSTIIIVKLLSDKRELDSLHGRISVGFLIVQDLAVVIAMMVMSALPGRGDASQMEVILSLTGRVIAAGVLFYALMRYFLPGVVRAMARSQELLLIFAIAWGTGFAALGEWAGFSKEAGAFLAGFSLASTSYRDAINARLSGIRDFLLIFFFIELGSSLDFSVLGDEAIPAFVLSLFVLIGNPLIVMAIMGYMGYRRRTGFLAGLTVAQISEFSIVFVALGISLGHVGTEALGLTTLVGLITIAISTYMILYSHQLYQYLAPFLGRFERHTPFREQAVETEARTDSAPEIVVFGLGRYGSRLARLLQEEGIRVLGVDFDPEKVAEMRERGISVIYGDAQESSFLDELPLKKAKWVVSTFPDIESNLAFLNALKEHRFCGEVAFVARDDEHGMALKQAGAPTVLYPMRDAVDYTVGHLVALVRPEESTE